MKNDQIRAFTSHQSGPIHPQDQWLTTIQASKYLGLSPKSLLNEVSNGNIPYYKLGKRNRYLKSELDQLILKNNRGPIWG